LVRGRLAEHRCEPLGKIFSFRGAFSSYGARRRQACQVLAGALDAVTAPRRTCWPACTSATYPRQSYEEVRKRLRDDRPGMSFSIDALMIRLRVHPWPRS
jgi:hypothetical protein